MVGIFSELQNLARWLLVPVAVVCVAMESLADSGYRRPASRRYASSTTAATLSARHRRSTYRHLNPAYRSSQYYSLRLPYRYSYGHMRVYNSGTVYRGYYGSLSNWPYGGLYGRYPLRYRPLFSSYPTYSYLRPYSSLYGPFYPYDLAYFTYPRVRVYAGYVPRSDWYAGGPGWGIWSNRLDLAPAGRAPILCSRPYYAYYYPTCCLPCCPTAENQRAAKPTPERAPEAAVPQSGTPPQKLAPHPDPQQPPDSGQAAPQADTPPAAKRQPAEPRDTKPRDTKPRDTGPRDTGPRLSLSPIGISAAGAPRVTDPRLASGRITVFRPTIMSSPSALKPRMVIPVRAAR